MMNWILRDGNAAGAASAARGSNSADAAAAETMTSRRDGCTTLRRLFQLALGWRWLALRLLPCGELRARAVELRIHRALETRHLRRQLDDIAVRIAEVDRADEVMVGDAARIDAGLLPFGEHLLERFRRDLERDVQVEILLLLEGERHV